MCLISAPVLENTSFARVRRVSGRHRSQARNRGGGLEYPRLVGDPIRTLAAILPAAAVGAELREGDRDDFTAVLHAEELAAIEGASPGRRREFAGGRECARRALRMLGVDAVPLPAGADGAPVWPRGVVGSITHKGSYRAAAVARARDLAGLGIDAELDAPLRDGVLQRVASQRELDEVERLRAERPETRWDRLLFSAKEAAMKAAYPLVGDASAIGLVDVRFEESSSVFEAVVAPGSGRETAVAGTWECRSGLLLVGASAAPAGPRDEFSNR